MRTWSERALKIGSKNCFKHHTWSVCNYKFPQFGFNKTSLKVSWRRKTVWVSNLQLLFPKISFSTSKECTKVFETIKFPSEYPQKTQLKIRRFISYLENVFPDVILIKRGKKLFMSNLFFQHSKAESFYNVKEWIVNYYVKESQWRKQTNSMFPENWHFNSRFVLEDNKKNSVCF